MHVLTCLTLKTGMGNGALSFNIEIVWYFGLFLLHYKGNVIHEKFLSKTWAIIPP